MSHGRSSSYGSGGWFQGTMEVISGMAPRPSTPQGLPPGGSHNPARSLSAPNSPARPGMFPGINRLPSQDSLDRSIHNESGHGKSTAQIIRDLKHSNAALSAKQASQEAHFMNQLSDVTKSFEEQRTKMDADIRALKKQTAALEAYKAAADAKLKEKDAALSKIKEESAFQRHNISDLKNQLYELQSELEEANANANASMPLESRHEMEQLLLDNQEMARELARLQADLRDSERARHDLERNLGVGKPPVPGNGGESPNSSYYHKYQETHSELERHRKHLYATQSTLEGLQAEKQSLQQEHAKTVEDLQLELTKQAEMFARREKDLQSQLDSLEFTDSQLNIELKRTLQSRDETIAAMQQELADYADKADDLAVQLAHAQKAATSQENYRRDEAEDLRILHDAQEEEITKLRKYLEDSQKELEMRDAELEEAQAQLKRNQTTGNSGDKEVHLSTELENVKTQLATAEKELEKLRSGTKGENSVPKEDPLASFELQRKLEESREQISELKAELDKTRSEHIEKQKTLQSSMDTLASEKKRLSEKLKAAEQQKGSKSEENNGEFTELRNHWEGKVGASQEAKLLKNEIEIHKQRIQEANDNERLANEKIQLLTQKVESLEAELSEQKRLNVESRSIETSTSEAHESTAEALQQAEEDLAKLQATLDQYEADTNKARKQLREAQIALVALDDEKKDMSQQHRELLAAVEKKKEDIQRSSQEMIAAKESEIETLKSELATVRQMLQTPNKTESTSRIAPITPSTTTPASPEKAAISKLEFTVRTLTKEKDALKVKLKDRDTTIAALVKSSVSLENKISSMETDLHDARSVQSEEKKSNEGEIFELRRTLSAMKDKEPRITEEVAALKRELKVAQQDANRWKRELRNDGASDSEYRYQIALLQKELDDSVERLKERDQAIENLVNQSMTQESHVRDLKTRISSLMKEVETVRSQRSKYDDSLLKAEIRRLQQETEMFAGQIIEQDEELQNMKRRVKQRDDQMLMLKREIAELKVAGHSAGAELKEAEQVLELKKKLDEVNANLRARDAELEEARRRANRNDPKHVIDLQAQLDELTEAYNDNRAELRELRKQLWDSKQDAGVANDLKLELAQTKYAFDEYKRTQKTSDSDEAVKTIESLKSDLASRNAKIADLEKNMSSLNEQQVAVFQTELDSLRSELSEAKESIDQLREEIKTKESIIQKLKSEGEGAQSANNGIASKIAELEMEKEQLMKENANLQSEIEEKAGMSAEIRTQLQKAREASEKSIVETYEKRLSAVNIEKEAVIDQLRRDLVEARNHVSEGNNEMSSQLQSLHAENEGLREQFEVELQAKNQQIYALEHTLHAQEQIVESMRAEMDQLQSGMEYATEKRRGEVESLQQELMQLESRALRQEREITALKMQVEESKLEHKAEVVRLKDVIVTMENERPLSKTVADLQKDDRMLEVRERLEQLKARNTALQEENLKLGGRLERKVIETRALEFEKERAEDLEKENGMLRRQMKELESILEASRSKTSQPNSKATTPKTAAPPPPNPTSASTSIPTSSEEAPTKPKEKPGKNRKGLKGLFKRRGFTANDVITEEEA